MTSAVQQQVELEESLSVPRQRRHRLSLGASCARTWRTPAVALAVLAVALAFGAATAGAATPARWIVFAATPPGIPVNQLFRIQSSGQGFQQITTGKLSSIAPAFSPDGKRIAFARTGAGIFTANLDGTGLRRLTWNARDGFPTWSPNGKQIAFVRLDKLEWHLYAMSSSGARPRRLVQAPPAGRPSWTSAGLLLSSGGDLVKIDPATGHVQKYYGAEVDAAWGLNTVAVSPDASTITFLGARHSNPGDMECGEAPCQRFALYIEDVRTVPKPGQIAPGARLLVPDVGPAAFSPDGTSLAYAAQGGLVIRSVAAGTAKRISTGKAYISVAAPPAWQPR